MKDIFGVLIVIILVIAVIVLGSKFGLFDFLKTKFGSSETSVSSMVDEVSDDKSSSETEPETEPIETTVEEKVYVEVTVKENEYLYQNSTMELDALTDALKQLDGDIIVRITDENASKQAFDALTDALDADGLAYEAAE